VSATEQHNRRRGRAFVAGALAVVLLVAVVAAASGAFGKSPRRAADPAVALPASGSPTPHTVAASHAAPKVGTPGLVPDPEEAQSFPVSAQAAAQHPAAISPAAAATSISPGAPSDQEVRQELQQLQQVEKTQATPAGAISQVTGAFTIPQGVPQVVAQVIAGGNQIADFPYVWGGGHASFIDTGYDCSGSVSYALAAGGMLGAPEVSGQLESWGVPGPGRWITVYAAAGHTFMQVDGAWFNTAGRAGPYSTRWSFHKPTLAGYVVRHWPGL
jgi:cell wall-associated NlpC family hydrolase